MAHPGMSRSGKTAVLLAAVLLGGAILPRPLRLAIWEHAPAVVWAHSILGQGASMNEQAQRGKAEQLLQEGNFREAYDIFSRLLASPAEDARAVCEDLPRAWQCLAQLNRTNEIDALIEKSVEAQSRNWRFLAAAAELYRQLPHQGFLIAGEFQRGPHRGGGEVVNSFQRDRVRALQLMRQAMPLADEDDNRADVARFYLQFAQMWLEGTGGVEAWRLGALTDLETLPDYEPGWGYWGGARGAPVDEEGRPIFYSVPKTFAEAANDGQRWRWCLTQAKEVDPRLADEVDFQFADFLWSQFGVQTMADYGWFFGRLGAEDSPAGEAGTWALHLLSEEETMARLAVGVRRFALPEEFNFIRIWRRLADEGGRQQVQALDRLAGVFENRRQYPKAAELLKRAVELTTGDVQQSYRERLRQIVGNWGRFEPVGTQPAGRGATVEYRFRNGKKVSFTAHEIRLDQLLTDVKAYLKSAPAELDWEKMDISNLGYRLVEKAQTRYLGAKVAEWSIDLTPRPNHFDDRVTVTTPLQKPGVYLLRADMEGGNMCFVILWVADTVLVKKPLDGRKVWLYVGDAVTGKPVSKANVEFFGWQQEWRNNAPRPRVVTKNFAEFSDGDGQLVLDQPRLSDNYQWLIIARTQEGRLAYLGFTGIWFGDRYDAQYQAIKTYLVTDRPIYRPGQKMFYKFWMRRAQYDMPESSDFAGKQVLIRLVGPRGDKLWERTAQADEFGGVEGEWEIPADAGLGVYQFAFEQPGGGHVGAGAFRVEEYKKPEFEVTVQAPEKPVALGEKVTASIEARYYFGSPVTEAKVKYKIERTDYTQSWYPPRPFDWLYEPGYWWFAYDYQWYPGWRSWGCDRPSPFWWPRSPQPPELVAEQEVAVGPDGKVEVTIDTALAKLLHPDQDHRYRITAEVTDQSRRTIVGTGEVIVTRQPFKVYLWVNRGYYRTGDVVAVEASARTADGRPVAGKGELTLYKIRYQEGKPVETAVRAWEMPTDEEGRAALQIRAAEPGQYRLALQVNDGQGHQIEGGYVFTIIGQAALGGEDFRFNEIELIPDKPEYQPGDTVQLQVNTNRRDGVVLLFVRPANGIYLPPVTVRLEGKTAVFPIPVTMKDMPNFFVEAFTVSDGKVFSEVREIVVPPEKRVFQVEVQPSKTEYLPGEKAAVKLKLTDLAGKPLAGSAIVAIYDKAVEYVSGGSNVPEIKAFFWKWRRRHHPQTEHSLDRQSWNIVPSHQPSMSDLGVFGADVVEEVELRQDMVATNGKAMTRRFAGGMGGAIQARAALAPMAAAMADGAMEKAAAESDRDALGLAEAPAGEAVEPTVRSEFADTALWVGTLNTAADGTAEVSLDMPQNLTTWRIKVWAMGHGTRVGEAAADVVTRKNLILRLQAPRFFVQTDEVVLSANVHNYLASAKSVEVRLQLEGGTLEALDETVQRVEIPAGGEARVDWRVRVTAEGEALIRMAALTDEESDAMEMRFPCHVHGMDKMVPFSGWIRPDKDAWQFTAHVPAERRPESARLEVRFSPTLAGAMVDALPYLIDYPYGCTEQTLNRFLPAAMTQKVLIDLGLDLDQIRQKRTNLNAQELGEAAERAAQWKRLDREPVFDQAELARIVKDGVQRLTEMQLSDGGWGWFSGWGEFSSPHTTAVVVHGLQIAQQNDVAIVPGVLERGVEWLKNYQQKQIISLQNHEKQLQGEPRKPSADNLDAFVYMVLADAGHIDPEMKRFLYRDRLNVSVYALAMFGLALEKEGDREKLDMVLRNIHQYVRQDDENQTAWLDLGQWSWWYWYGSEIEAMAYYLKLLSRTDPKGELSSRLVKYLLNNRKHATYWNSTRDTALVVEAFADYIRASGEDRPEMTVEVYVDGTLRKAVEITPQNLFTFDNAVVLLGEELAEGDHAVEVRRRGGGPLYINAYLSYFSLEDFIPAAGLEIKVARRYYRLIPVEATAQVAGSRGQVIDQRVEKYRREELANLAEVRSGDLVEIELVLESKNDYEYLVFEDMKPAGFEPVDLRSGYTRNALGAYVEFRDNRVAFFCRSLARGTHSVAYRMRAEIPGKFSALPTRGYGMYAPELRANSDEIKLRVIDVPIVPEQ
ncbi:MAG: MG2 domain-containing protein [Thermogutta sp.]